MNAYWHGQYFFDVHPPLAKMLVSFLGYLLGVNNEAINWASIGNILPDTAILIRLVPMIAGAILPLIIYAILRKIGISRTASFVAGLLLAVENSLIVQSRFILFDELLIIAGFASIYFYLLFRGYRARLGTRDARSLITLIATMIFAATAFNIKWTGLSFAGMIFLMEIYSAFSHYSWTGIKKLALFVSKKVLPFTAVFGGTILLFSVLVYTVHFAALPYSGNGDDFMSDSFVKSLNGSRSFANPDIAPEGTLSKIAELNIRMFDADGTLTAQHPYSSKWYAWPLMMKPIFYWQSHGEVTPETYNSYVYYLGNPVVYWFGTFAMILLVMYLLWHIAFRKSHHIEDRKWHIILFLVIGYMANYLPFIFIGRVMFLYHYEVALVFGVMAIAYLIEILPEKQKRIVAITISVLAFSAYLYWSPITYGTPIQEGTLNSLMWFSGWR